MNIQEALCKAIREVDATTSFQLSGNDYDSFKVLPVDDGDGNKSKDITFDRDSVITRAKAIKALGDVQDKRTNEYPSIKEQLDLQYWDQVNGTTKWKEAIAKVKSDNPKP